MRKTRNYQILGPAELSAKENARAERMIDQAEDDFKDVNVNFRWTKDKVDIVKQAAEALGIPYQTYLKQVILRQALKDINAVATATLLGKEKRKKPAPPAAEEQEAPARSAKVVRAKAKPGARTANRRQVTEA